MGCSGCSTGRGANNLPGGCKNNGSCGTGGCNKLNVFDWLSNMDDPSLADELKMVEVRFKNGRKGYFTNAENLSFSVGDVVAVESSPGHDIGAVSLVGELVRLQVQKKGVKPDEIKKIYRKARQTDIDKWQEAMRLEKPTMTQARKHAIELGLDMKICDVEYQGDKTKATFYYTAERRVDFRELIKRYASSFKVRIEMRQIGARQEAARLGGLGSCGRELCCSSWLTDFRSVTTSAARYQQLSLNPQKLAGQCGKLKCCLNFELDSYLDALKDFPETTLNLKSKDEEYFHFKTDIFKGLYWYICRQDRMKMIAVPVARVKQVLEMNQNNKYPEVIVEIIEDDVEPQADYMNVVGQDDLTRFDNDNKKKKRPSNKKFNKPKPNKNRDNAPKARADEKDVDEDKKSNQPQRKNRPKKPNPNRKPEAAKNEDGKPKEGGNKKRNFSKNRKPNNKRPQGNRPSADKGGETKNGGGAPPKAE